MLFRISFVALLTLLVTPLTAAGQLLEGSKVRVKLTGELADDGSVTPSNRRQSILAKFVAMEPDHLILAVGSTSKTIRVPKAAVSDLEIRRGRSRLKGALVGAGVGGLVGVVWGFAERSRACEDPHPAFCDLAFVGPIVIAPPIGAIVGFVIGKARWVKVPPTAFTLGVMPAADGVRIGGILKF